jgi:hypothetical protein
MVPTVERGLRLVDFWSIETFDEVDVGLVHLPEELARVRGERLHVAPLALGEDRVESQARLAGAGQPREDDQAVPRQVEIYAAQVVLAGAANNKTVCHWGPFGCDWRVTHATLFRTSVRRVLASDWRLRPTRRPC